MKRVFDFTFSLIFILVLLPLIILIGILLLLTGEHYIFYKQKRIGLNGKKFNLIKFATMLKNCPGLEESQITLKNDPRILPIGKLLRKTKMNELPQLINILKGDMSFVGPRPQPPLIFDMYSKKEQKIITQMRPGLTGIGSIVFRNEESLLEKNSLPWENLFANEIMPYKAKLEIWYHKNKSFTLDLLLICITFWVVIYPNSKIIGRLFKTLPKENSLFPLSIMSETNILPMAKTKKAAL